MIEIMQLATRAVAAIALTCALAGVAGVVLGLLDIAIDKWGRR